MRRGTAFLLILVMVAGLFLPGVAEEITGYSKKAKTYTYVRFGVFPTDENGEKQPILWRVLSSDGKDAYLLSEYVLLAHRVDPEPYPYAGWEKSELYAYLNDEFLNIAFTGSEQAVLVSHDDGALITLPTSADLKNADYGFSTDAKRQAQSTEYAKANGLFVYQGRQKYSPYWTRTPSVNHDYAHIKTKDNGALGYICVEVANVGVRPVITVDLKDITIQSGDGTKNAPYQLAAAAIADTTPISAEIQSEYPADDVSTDEIPSEDDGAPSAEFVQEAISDAAALDPRFHGLGADGFLPSGSDEFVYSDSDEGIWLYASDNIRIEIKRQTDLSKKSRPLRWLEADLYVKDGSDFLKVFYNDPENPKKEAEIKQIGRKNHLVFAINADWYYYRVKRNAQKRVMSVGVILRQGKILYDDPAKKASTSIPNRDILALYPDGGLEVYDFNGINADELKDKGAYDVLSFGPVLVKNGEITKQTANISAHQSNNPRMGIGQVEKGHYVAILVEGRISESKGCTLVEMAQKFLDKGCVNAYNLDGGGTATMLFMGEYINKLGSYTADKRLQTEVLGLGISDQVQP